MSEERVNRKRWLRCSSCGTKVREGDRWYEGVELANGTLIPASTERWFAGQTHVCDRFEYGTLAPVKRRKRHRA